MYRRWGKRLFDIVLSLLGLLLLAVPGCVVALLVRRRFGSPVLVGEQRVGRNGRLFTLYRFRSSIDRDHSSPGRALDTLPLLWHVLAGDMSLVGPQPEAVGFANRLAESEHRVLELRPGLTGPASLQTSPAFSHRLQTDLRYLDQMSWWQDSWILLAAAYTKSPVYAGWRRLRRTLQPARVLGAAKKAVWIVGSGSQAKAVCDTAEQAGFEAHEVSDETLPAGTPGTATPAAPTPGRGPQPRPQPQPQAPAPAEAGSDWLDAAGSARAFIVAVADNQDRRRWFEELAGRGHEPMTLIHPEASVSPRAVLGRGVWVASHATISAGVVLGDDCLVDAAASIDADCRIGAHAHIGPGAHLAANVSVGEETTLGIASCVLPDVKIGNKVGVGGGAVVVEDVPDDSAVVTAPARVVQLKHAHRAKN